ncbi:putative galactinol--sucrose galactosyltransferase [Arachis hypogaea]|nr:putative galactinol--sucrose galactosyltransferase [Arachis hypogaea]
MTQKMGDKGREIPLETQFLFIETKDNFYLKSDDDDKSNQIIYTVFLPFIEESFRACLKGNDCIEFELCIGSGNSDTKVSSFSHVLFINAGTNPLAVTP